MELNPTTMHNSSIEDLLEKWEKQKAPDFLSTRILSQINTSVDENVSYFSWATFGLLLLINCSILYRTMEDQSTKSSSKNQHYANYIESNYQLFTNYPTNE